MKTQKWLFILVVLFLMLASCTSQPKVTKPSQVLTSIPVQTTDTLLPTNTTVVTLPATATFTLMPSETMAITATQGPKFASFTVFNMVPEANGTLTLGLLVPGLKESLKVVIDSKQFFCVMDPAYLGRLFCTGPILHYEKSLVIKFMSLKGDFIAYEGTLVLPEPAALVPTLPACDPKTWCPDRGVKFHCETEVRTWYEPTCTVSTCVDLCGYCYSVDTCGNSKPKQ